VVGIEWLSNTVAVGRTMVWPLQLWYLIPDNIDAYSGQPGHKISESLVYCYLFLSCQIECNVMV
jgi:hypothetical protein